MEISNIVFFSRQFYGRIIRYFKPKRLPDEGVLRLHLGCGAIDHPGFINIDGIDRPHVHFVQSLTHLTRFQDNSVTFIYTSHTLEHFPRIHTVPILKEWFRVLAPSGRLCVSVPDFEQILKLYNHSGNDVDFILPPLFGGQDYPFNFHHTTFNKASLTKAFKDAGFSSVNTWVHGIDAFHNLPDWSGRAIKVKDISVPISLNLEATKRV